MHAHTIIIDFTTPASTPAVDTNPPPPRWNPDADHYGTEAETARPCPGCAFDACRCAMHETSK